MWLPTPSSSSDAGLGVLTAPDTKMAPLMPMNHSYVGTVLCGELPTPYPHPRPLHRTALGLNQKNCTMDFTPSDERGNKKESSLRHTCSMQVLWTYSGWAGSWQHQELTHTHACTRCGRMHARERFIRKRWNSLHMCMKRPDISEEDIIRDILWLKGWLGGCCRCTYSEW